MKYLVTWKLKLGRKEMDRISTHPEVLDKGMQYVNYLKNEGYLLELRQSVLPKVDNLENSQEPNGVVAFKNPSGTAIFEAESIDEVKNLVEGGDLGSTTKGFSILTYLEYDVKLLSEKE